MVKINLVEELKECKGLKNAASTLHVLSHLLIKLTKSLFYQRHESACSVDTIQFMNSGKIFPHDGRTLYKVIQSQVKIIIE